MNRTSTVKKKDYIDQWHTGKISPGDSNLQEKREEDSRSDDGRSCAWCGHRPASGVYQFSVSKSNTEWDFCKFGCYKKWHKEQSSTDLVRKGNNNNSEAPLG